VARLLPESAEAWAEAARVVLAGGVVAFPTDTVYGVGCNPYDPDAILRIYVLKGRDFQKALPLLLSGVDAVDAVARYVPEVARVLGARFWPGALTLVVPRQPTLPTELAPSDSVAVRVPDHVPLCKFIETCSGAIAATSANISGQPDALTARDVIDYFGSRVDLIIDGGPARGGIPSTVVDCTVDPPSVVRKGAISEHDIRHALPAQHATNAQN
jgi:L-threonylcarbamoyladenylate synthase